MLISFESTCEGAGKTSQIRLVMVALDMLGIPAISLKFPNSSYRQFLLSNKLPPRAHMLIQHAEFANSLETDIKPALEEGKVVLLDRWIDSSYAYQGFGSGIDLGEINRSLEFAIGSYKPDITILLDLDPNEAKARVKSRASVTKRIAEIEGDEFSEKVRAGYLSLADKFSHRISLVDASGTEGEVFIRIRDLLPCFNRGQKEES